MRISDWSSDVCSSDLQLVGTLCSRADSGTFVQPLLWNQAADINQFLARISLIGGLAIKASDFGMSADILQHFLVPRSEEHTSELQSLMRISYAVFCLKKQTLHTLQLQHTTVYYHAIHYDKPA